MVRQASDATDQDPYDAFIEAVQRAEGQTDLTLGHAAPLDGASSYGPNLGAGGGVSSPYISFNRTDQLALIGGGGAALGGTICIVGTPVACVVAGTIIAVATTYAIAYGRCSTAYPNLRVYLRPRPAALGCYA